MVGGYTLISRLGAGAMGSVWRAQDDGGQTYAMKILRDSLSDDDLKQSVTARERLRREAMAMRRIHHPGVCQIVDMELDDALAFIVTELIDGRNLRDDVNANGRYVAEDLQRLAAKLIDAVKAVHRAGIVHRDIKPTNVMVAARGPVLVDFGIAMGEGESHVTRTGLVMGTPGFIAPEIIEGAESNEASDWWSTAAVLAFAATGAPVFGTKPMMTVLERAASGNANLAGLPARTMAAFRAALAPRPGDRCTPDELLAAITADASDAAWNEEDTESGEQPIVTVAMPPAPPAPAPAQQMPPAPPLQGARNAAQNTQNTQNTQNARTSARTEGTETQVVRPFGASSSGADAGMFGAAPSADAGATMTMGVAGTVPMSQGMTRVFGAPGASDARVLSGTSDAPTLASPRTLWGIPPVPEVPPTPPLPDELSAELPAIVPSAAAHQPDAAQDAAQNTTQNAAQDPARNADPMRRESRSDLIVGIVVGACILAAVIAACLGM
ncbi:protein kinase [Bifidobacterium sp. DSM 109958]|uniref:Protein kinase n=1 Tax=Bifidobacterium moraviense TaxID=2675323 RepID=A0A7Y0I083_9BIFI|nr:protein kinase [Bifidobacterium sp. DSM 109958]